MEKKTIIFFISILVLATESLAASYIVWNVGQGSWSTFVTSNQCYHFDCGGEFYPRKLIQSFCSEKENQFFITHFDWDHYSFYNKIYFLKNTCFHLPNNDSSIPPKLTSYLKQRACPKTKNTFIKEINYNKSKFTNKNNQSRVFIVDKKILITGDSERKSEKLWTPKLNTNSYLYLMGHHGSRTSGSEPLIQKLKVGSIAIASARRKKYSHPAPKSIRSLRAKKIPSLLTEDWGSILFEMD